MFSRHIDGNIMYAYGGCGQFCGALFELAEWFDANYDALGVEHMALISGYV